MITFKQFISEEDKLPSLADILERDCQPFLRASRGAYLRRGVKGLTMDNMKMAELNGEEIRIFTKDVRKDREPRDTVKAAHTILDNYFKKKFGFAARSSTMFCVGMKASTNALSGYGVPCMVFPIGEFKYVWSPKVKDLYFMLGEKPESLTKESPPEEWYDWLDTFEYQTTNFGGALEGRDEIMILCDQYYAVALEGNEDALKDMLEKL